VKTWLPALLLVLALGLALEPAGHAQQPSQTPTPRPTPTPTPVPTGPCAETRQRRQGGEVILVRETDLRLPDRGEFAIRSRVSADHTELEVCHIETDSSVHINMTTSQVLRTRITYPEGVEVLNEVIASVRHLTFGCRYQVTRVHGGETVRPIRAMEFVLPGSDEYNWVWIPPGRLIICHLPSNSSLFVTTPPVPTIDEVRREVASPAGDAILDEVLRAIQAAKITIDPPRTGDAGLR
jgi:hypothetical protein